MSGDPKVVEPYVYSRWLNLTIVAAIVVPCSGCLTTENLQLEIFIKELLIVTPLQGLETSQSNPSHLLLYLRAGSTLEALTCR